MSDTTEIPPVSHRKPGKWGRQKIGTIPIESTTDAAKRAYAERLADPLKDPLGEHHDRFPSLFPEEIEQETRNVRLDMTFGDPIKIRDQAEMIIRIMQEVVGRTREHHLGSIRQRMEARRVVDAGRRTLARFNGRTPHGDTAKKR